MPLFHGVLGLGLLGLILRPAMFLALGYAVHLLMDALGAEGVRWLYPITQYGEKGHRVRLYRTGGVSEALVVIGIVGICFLVTVLV